jgi:5,10-methylenetetrahydrofolate reductase
LSLGTVEGTSEAAGVTLGDSGDETEPETLYSNDDARSREIGEDTAPHYPCREQQAVSYRPVQ